MTTVEELIKHHEGCRLVAYTDSTGHSTIGWGHNLVAAPLAPDLFEPDGSISQATADEVFEDDLAAVQASVASSFPWTAYLSAPRLGVIQDMAFNMGVAALGTFHSFLDLVQRGDFGGAARDMLGTLWARQVGVRAVEDAEIMNTGVWPE